MEILQLALLEVTLRLLLMQNEIFVKMAQARVETPEQIIYLVKLDVPKNGQISTNSDILPPIFEKIGWCESRNRQFNNKGGVLTSVTNDLGLYQINSPLHEPVAKNMNIDIRTLEGNIKYAEFLYSKNGLRDWFSSKHCWST